MFSHVEYFLEVYKTGSFSKAADNLYISQPSLSATIKKIEDRIGCRIFDRSTNPVQLTDCGQEYIKAVMRITEIKNEFENYLNDRNELKIGRVAVGVSNLFASFILPPIITRFKQQYPGIEINLLEASTTRLEKQLLDGELDIIIDNYDLNTALYKKIFFYKENLILAAPLSMIIDSHLEPYRLTAMDIRQERHLQHDLPQIDLNMFENRPFISLRSGNDTKTRFDKICAEAHFKPNVILELDQLATAYHIVCYGMGVTLVSDMLVKKVKPDESVAFFKVNSPNIVRDVFFYYKLNKYVTRSMEAFLSIAMLQS